MKFRIPNKLTHMVPAILQRSGYTSIVDRNTGKQSYTRKLTQNRYPRFHLYVSESSREVVFDLHLDQSKTRYEGQTAHNADYESEEVKLELTKVYQTVAKYMQK